MAAGLGSRMRSATPKVLHPLCGTPLIQHVAGQIQAAVPGPPVLVVSPKAQALQQLMGTGPDYVVQKRPTGTGHALLATRPLLEGDVAQLLVTYGDIPLLTQESLVALLAHHTESGADVTLLTAIGGPRDGMGRVLRDRRGRVAGIVEESDTSREQRDIPEVNGGVYCLRTQGLWPLLKRLPEASNGEGRLTDLMSLTLQSGGRVEAVAVGDAWELLGINTRVDLAQAEGLMRERIRRTWMLRGVTLEDPTSTFIDSAVEVGQDTVILPNTHLHGATRIGRECRLGPNAIIVSSTIGDGCRVVASMLEEVTLEPQADVGPFSHLRPGAYLERGVHVGNFVEVKESRLGQGTKVGHFSYLGDATLGPEVNIGAGTVTCNYDGEQKHRTVIEAGASIGSDTMLVAPVTVGRRAVTGAGAVVTHDVEPNTLVMGVPARPETRRTSPRGNPADTDPPEDSNK